MTAPTLSGSRRPGPPRAVSVASAYWTTDRWRLLARFALATTAAAVICLVLAKLASPTLPRSIENIGYPSFADYNYTPLFWKYRLAVYLFPALTIGFHALLTRWGPLRRVRQPRAAGQIALADAEGGSGQTDGLEAGGTVARDDGRPRWSMLARIGVPAAVTVVAAGSGTGHTGIGQLVWGLGYVLAVGLLAAAHTSYFLRPRSAPRSEPRLLATAGLAGARSSRSSRFWQALPTVNAVAASAAALLGLWYVSASTIVHTPTGDQAWPWFPLWLALAGVAGAAWWALRELRRGRAPRAMEARLLTVLVGSIAIFLSSSALPGPVSYFQGFDDALEMAGASLLSRGDLPWRDMLFVHGLYPDVLTGSLGAAVFGDTVWGIFAIHSVLLAPLGWVIIYLYACWVSKGNGWFLALFGVVLASGLFPALGGWGGRFFVAPLVLILLGETLRRRSPAWAVGLTLATAVQAVLVPETIFLAAPVLGCVVAAELVHRQPGIGRWRALRLSRWCAATGAVFLLGLATALAAYGALGGFVDYYLIVGSGHNETGAIPAGFGSREYGLLFIEFGVVLATIWATAARIGRRGDWTARDWVGVALAGFVALYLEKALGRLDAPHVWQNFTAALPLVLFLTWQALHGLNRGVQWLLRPGQHARPSWRSVGPRLVNAPIVVALVLVLLANSGPLLALGRAIDTRHRLTAVADPEYRLGYAVPTAIDPGLLHDLDVVLRTYAGDDGTVFDMTNSPGYVYFLLGRDPGTRFNPVALAETPHAQRLLIGELERSRPPVVIFDSTQMGLPSWDWLTNNVRHYLLSQYLLQNWTPVLRTHGNLILVRRDLAVANQPAPILNQPPQLSDLYFSGPTCAWGSSAAYLPTTRTGTRLTLTTEPVGSREVVKVTGWAVDPSTGRAATSVLVVNDQHRVIATVAPTVHRPDVAASLGPGAGGSGFHYGAAVPPGEHVGFYLLSADGSLHSLAGGQTNGASEVTLLDGRTVPVAVPPAGSIDSETRTPVTLSTITVPSGVTLTDYQLATVSSGPGPLGASSLVLTDQPGQIYHDISAASTAWIGSELTIPVGSCPQWYGYDPAKPLYVVQQGGAPVTSITLSRSQ